MVMMNCSNANIGIPTLLKQHAIKDGAKVESLLPNPPSIPSHDNVFGYEINNRGDLVRQPNPDKTHTGMNNDKVGPQNYEVTVPKVTKGVTTWKKPKTADAGALNNPRSMAGL